MVTGMQPLRIARYMRTVSCVCPGAQMQNTEFAMSASVCCTGHECVITAGENLWSHPVYVGADSCASEFLRLKLLVWVFRMGQCSH